MIANSPLVTTIMLSREAYSDFDEQFRARRITYLGVTFKQVSYDCCGVESEIERDGTRTDYGYDDLKRRTSVTRNGITTIYTYDGADRVVSVSRKGTDNSVMVQESSVYDAAGRLLFQTNALGNHTTFLETVVNNQMHRITINPEGGTITNRYFRNGTLAETSGTATQPVRYTHGVSLHTLSAPLNSEYRRWTVETRLDANGGTNEWVKTYLDSAGNIYKKEFAAASAPYPTEWMYFNTRGQLTNQVDADGVSTFLAYNGKAELAYTVLNSNRNTTIDYAGPDRISYVTNDVVNNGTANVRRSRTYVWNTSANTSNLVSTAEASVDGLRSWNTILNNGTAITSQSRTVYDAANGYRYVTNIAPDNSYSVAITRYGTNVSVTAFDSINNQLSSINYSHDAHGRQNSVTDARIGATTFTFNNADQVVTMTTPVPGAGQSAQVTTSYFDVMGRVWKSVLPDNTSVTNEYFLTGQLKKSYGSRTYPVEYTYDAQSRMKTMKTWKDFVGNSGTAITTWNYDNYRGFLTNKTYDGGAAGPTYTYTAAGRLATRVWARMVGGQPLATTYAYNFAGDLSTVFYSDGTAGVTNTFDRLGQTLGVTNGANVCVMDYNDAGALLTERYTAGLLSGVGVTNSYDQLLRRTNVATVGSSTGYKYDTASRLKTVTALDSGLSTLGSAGYAYLANSPLVSQIAFTNGSALRMTTTKQHDLLNRLTSITNLPSAASAVGYRYAYNNANQRTSVTNADTARWVYQYDSLGQVTSGKKYWSDGTPVAGQQFEYAFDDIGNRKSTANGGDQFGVNLRSAGYTNNSLNQITGRSVPGYVDVLGSATNAATVTVNNQPTYRKGDYFRAELTAANSNPLWFGLTNLAVLNNGTNADIVASATGFVFVAKTPEIIGYDADGNMTNDGRWLLTWDAENRLTKAESLASTPAASKRKVEWTYDYRGRRVRQTTSDGSSGSYVVTEDLKFMADGWRHIAELNATNNALVRSYAWGLDLSGSLDGAGGVGGLLMLNSVANAAHFYAYDGNGNTTALIKAGDGTVSQQCEYEAFGKIIRNTGLMAVENRFLFSTKRCDPTTDFELYEYRVRRTDLTWLNNDPLGEKGGLNLYCFVGNNVLNKFDALGLSSFPVGWLIPVPMLGVFDNEYSKKSLFYKSISQLFSSPHWKQMLQDWYEENGKDELLITDQTDPRTKDIISNVGFDKMLRCLLKMMEEPNTQVTGLGANSEIKSAKGEFYWHYAFSRSQSPGGEAAYTDAINFLGSYNVSVKKLGGDEYEVTVKNTTGWTSATAFPKTGHDLSLWSDHARREGFGTSFGLPSRGGNWPQTYKFKVKACPGDCKFP